MNDNRQAYVFLQDRDVIQEGDEYYDTLSDTWEPSPCAGEKWNRKDYETTRRPVPTPAPLPDKASEQDKMTVWDMYATIAYEKNIDTHSAEHYCAEIAKAYADEMMKVRVNK